MADPIPVKAVSRRTVLKGIAGTAGLVSVPAIIAACGTTSSSSAPAETAAATEAASAAPSAAESVAPGSLTLGSNLSDDVPKGALQAVVDAFTADSGITVTVNTVDHSTFQDQLSNYLQATPDDVFTWFSGYRMRFFAGQGLATDISDLWSGSIGGQFTDAFKTASTGDDGKQYFVPFVTYTWTVYYRPSLWQEKGYAIPATLDEFKALAQKMQADGLDPIGLGQQDGWPAMGHFDIINLRENGYQFHVDLMAGKEKWADPKVKHAFEVWKGLLPFYQAGSAGRKWQDAAAGLVQKKTGMMLQPQVAETFKAAGDAELADLDFFPWPNHGTEWDAEKAMDAPIDGFMISAKSPNLGDDLDSAKAFMEYVGSGAAQVIYTQANPSLIPTASDADQSSYNPLQKKQAETIATAQKLTQFLDRDTDPRFAGKDGMQAFLTDFISNPDQDLDALLSKIQTYWDSLGPA